MMRKASLWVLLGIFFLAPGGFYLWAQSEAPVPIILDGFAARSFDGSLWRVAPEKPACLQSDGAARLTYQPGASYSVRENITSLVALPEQFVVQVDMLGGVQVVEMAPAALPAPAPLVPWPTGYGTPSVPAGPSLPATGPPAGIMPGMKAMMPPGGEMGGETEFQAPQAAPSAGGALGLPAAVMPAGRAAGQQARPSPAAQIRQFAKEAIAREKRGAMTVTGHYIKSASYARGPQVGISLLGQNFWLSATFRGVGDPNPADPPGLSICTGSGPARESQLARIPVPPGQWVSLRLEVDGAKVVVRLKDRPPVEATLPATPTRIQIGDLGPEKQPFSVEEKAEYLFDDVRAYAGLGPDFPPDDYLAAGDGCLSHQDYANAAIEFERATVASPSHPGAITALAYARAFSEGATKTLPGAEQATANSPDSFLAHYYLGRFYLDMMRYDDAVKELTSALELAPDSPAAHTWLGLALFQREARFPDEQLASDSEALHHLEFATSLLPTSAEAHQSLGLCLLSAKQAQRAQDELLKALELDQSLFDARLTLTALMEPNRFGSEDTVANVRLLVEGNPSYPHLLLAILPAERRAAPAATTTTGAVAPVAGQAGAPAFPGMMGGPGMMPGMMGMPGMTGMMGAPGMMQPGAEASAAGGTGAAAGEIVGYQAGYVAGRLINIKGIRQDGTTVGIASLPQAFREEAERLLQGAAEGTIGGPIRLAGSRVIAGRVVAAQVIEVPRPGLTPEWPSTPEFMASESEMVAALRAAAGGPPAGGETAPTARPPATMLAQAVSGREEVDTFEYLRRANQWRDNGMLRPAVEEYRRWLGTLLSRGKFQQVAKCTEEMAKAYRAAGLPALEAYALYLPAEPRNTDEWPQITAYVAQRGADFTAARDKALASPLTPDRRAWLTYMKGVMQMATTSPAPGWRDAIETFKSVEEMAFWPKRGDAIIHMGSCYLAVNRPYLAEGVFERALNTYQEQAGRLALLGAPVAPWEAERLQTRVLNCGRYVNLAREQNGKLPKYDTGDIVEAPAPPLR